MKPGTLDAAGLATLMEDRETIILRDMQCSRCGSERTDLRRLVTANELEIVHALRKLGCRVLRLSGKGVPDLAVLWPPKGGWTLAEVKGARGRLTEAQATFATDPHVRIWRSLDDALADLGMVRR